MVDPPDSDLVDHKVIPLAHIRLIYPGIEAQKGNVLVARLLEVEIKSVSLSLTPAVL